MNVKNIGGNDISKISTNSIQQRRNEGKIQGDNISRNIVVNDKLQISEEGKKMQEIRKKIENGFYNSNNVIEITSKKILEKLK